MTKRISAQEKAWQAQYTTSIATLWNVGVLDGVSAKSLSYLGADGKRYAVPEFKDVKRLLTRHKKLVAQKSKQGFTRLLMTPFAMPVPRLIQVVSKTIKSQAKAGGLNDRKGNPIRIKTLKPFWIWRRFKSVLETPRLVYFPQSHHIDDSKGLDKRKAMRAKKVCAIPGWSIGLVREPDSFNKKTPQRPAFKKGLSPQEYFEAMRDKAYVGETGWTLEDFLTDFILRLVQDKAMVFDRSENNAAWLLGMYVPSTGFRLFKDMVPVAYWDRGKLYMSMHRSANHFQITIAPTMVRL